jgi:hypothetical protein
LTTFSLTPSAACANLPTTSYLTDQPLRTRSALCHWVVDSSVQVVVERSRRLHLPAYVRCVL